jgi:hypothetical protein
MQGINPFYLVAAILFAAACVFFAHACSLMVETREPLDTCERAVHHRAHGVGYECCYETCGDAGVAGYIVTENGHACACGRKP